MDFPICTPYLTDLGIILASSNGLRYFTVCILYVHKCTEYMFMLHNVYLMCLKSFSFE